MPHRALHVPRSCELWRIAHCDRRPLSVAGGIPLEVRRGLGLVGATDQRHHWLRQLPYVFGIWLSGYLARRCHTGAVTLLYLWTVAVAFASSRSIGCTRGGHFMALLGAREFIRSLAFGGRVRA